MFVKIKKKKKRKERKKKMSPILTANRLILTCPEADRYLVAQRGQCWAGCPGARGSRQAEVLGRKLALLMPTVETSHPELGNSVPDPSQ